MAAVFLKIFKVDFIKKPTFKIFRNDNFYAGQVVKENYLVCTLTFLQYYRDMLSTCIKTRNECGICKKKKKKKI